MSRVAGSTEDAVRNHLRRITLAELVRGLHSRR
jgi:hypothetical protein